MGYTPCQHFNCLRLYLGHKLTDDKNYDYGKQTKFIIFNALKSSFFGILVRLPDSMRDPVFPSFCVFNCHNYLLVGIW